MPEQVIETEAGTRFSNAGGVTLVGVSNAEQTISVTGAPTGGTFELTWPDYPSATIPHDAASGDLQALLDVVFGAGNTLVSGGALPGAPLVVTFQGDLAGITIPLPTIDDTLLAGGVTPHAHVAVTAAGGGDELLIAANISREAFIISADVADVYLGYGATAQVGKGYKLRATDPPFTDRSWRGDVHVVSTGAAEVSFTELNLASGDDQGERPTGADDFVPSGPSDSFSADTMAQTQDTTGETYPPQPS